MHYMPTKSQHVVNEMMSQILENAFVIFYLFVFLYFICISVNQKEFPFQQENYKYCISISKYIKIFWCSFDIMNYQKYPYMLREYLIKIGRNSLLNMSCRPYIYYSLQSPCMHTFSLIMQMIVMGYKQKHDIFTIPTPFNLLTSMGR